MLYSRFIHFSSKFKIYNIHKLLNILKVSMAFIYYSIFLIYSLLSTFISESVFLYSIHPIFLKFLFLYIIFFMENISICHVNAQSLRAHFIEFKDFFNIGFYDVIAVSETWLSPNVTSNLVELDDYNLFRNDRNTRRGGGVCLYIRKSFRCALVAESSESVYPTAEFLFLNMQSQRDSALVGVVYKPPNASFGNELENQIFSLIQWFNNIIIMGDFNCNLNTHSTITNYFTSMVYSAGLDIVPHSDTHHTDNSSTRIDAMIVDDLDKVISSAQHSVPFLSNHDLIWIKFRFDEGPLRGINRSSYVRNLKAIPETDFITHLAGYDWASLYSSSDINVKVYKLTQYLTTSFDFFAPLHPSKARRRYSPWMTDELRGLIKERNRFRRIAKRTKNINDHSNFKKMRNLVQTKIRDAYNKYNFNTIKNKSRSENIWHVLKRLNLISQKNNKLYLSC